MPNNNTIAVAKASGGKYLPSDAMGASSTSEAQFTKGATTNPVILYVPGSGKIANQPIKIKAWGRVTGGTTTNFTAQIYMGTQTTIASNTSIATTGAIACNSASGSWELEVRGIWDSTSKYLQGRMQGRVNATAVALAIASAVNQPNSATTTEGLGFTATGTFSASNANNAATLDGFEIEAD